MIDTKVEKTANGGVIIDIALPVLRFERVGAAYANLMRQLKKGQGVFSNHAENSEEEESLSSNDADFIEVDVTFLRSLDPKEWKDQDHYKVLGLELKRIDATEDDIKRAYRKIVLNHHPDKRKAKGETVSQDNDYFTCITRAYEILGEFFYFGFFFVKNERRGKERRTFCWRFSHTIAVKLAEKS